MRAPESRGATGSGFAAIGVAAFAIACCAGGPLVLGAVSGLAVGAVLGLGAGAAVLVVVVAMTVVRVRRRRACGREGQGGS
jgi:hypothetical protein